MKRKINNKNVKSPTNNPKVKPSPAPAQPAEKTRLDIAWEWFENLNYKWIFWISFGICFAFIVYWASQSGINNDSPIDYEYGVQCKNYYLSLGKDTTCLHFHYHELERFTQKYYGSGFEGTFALLQYWFKWDNYYKVRLYYLALWSMALLLFISLIAKEFSGWKGAVFALWIAFLSPFLLGQFLWNTKDVPHALGYAIAIFFMLRFLRKLPEISIKNLLGISLGIAVALSVRIGGLLLGLYIGLFALLACIMLPKVRSLFVNKQFGQILKIGGFLFVAIVLGILIGLLFYPNFIADGFNHLQSSFNRATDNTSRVPLIFEGVSTDSLKIPWYYLMKMFYITTPVFTLVLLHLSVLILIWKWKKIGALNVFILLFTLVFPFAYMMYTKAPVYNGWRHILFAYVTAPAIVAIGLKEILIFLKKPILKFILIALIAVAFAYLFAWNVRNAPYQLGYFNSLVGGPKGAFKKYDTDVLQVFTNEGTYWILNSLNPDDYSEDRPLVIAMNNDPVRREFYIPPEWRGKVELKTVAFRNYSSLECDFTVLTTLFATPKVLSSFWPPTGTVYERVVDGAVIGCVVDRREHTDWKGIKLVQSNEFEEGVRLMEQAYEYNPKNYTLYFWLGYGYYRVGNHEKAIEFLKRYEKFYPSDEQTHRILGYAYFAKKEYDEALKAFNITFAQNRSNMDIAHMIALCLYEKKDYKAGIRFLEPLVKENPSFVQGKNLLEHMLRLANS